jgi:iron complex outermembrane receptor protein
VAGTHGPTGISGDTGTPKDRAQGTFGVTVGPAEVGVIVNYVAGYANTDPSIGAGGPGQGGCLNAWFTPCHIASFTDWDLFSHYDLTKQFQVTGHILNLFNRDAPFDPQAAYGTRNYNSAFAQQGAIGRFFEVGFRYLF